MKTTRTAADVAALVQLSCLLEVSAPKPGNVSPGRHFADLTYEDFLTSAVAIGPTFARVADQPLGETIRQAVEVTACWTRTNTKDRKSTRLNSSHLGISYAVFCLKKKKTK